MGMEGLIQALGAPLLALVVEGIKRLFKLAGIQKDVATPLITAILGVLYMSLVRSGEIIASEDVVTGVGVGGSAAILWKIFRTIGGLFGTKT